MSTKAAVRSVCIFLDMLPKDTPAPDAIYTSGVGGMAVKWQDAYSVLEFFFDSNGKSVVLPTIMVTMVEDRFKPKIKKKPRVWHGRIHKADWACAHKPVLVAYDQVWVEDHYPIDSTIPVTITEGHN